MRPKQRSRSYADGTRIDPGRVSVDEHAFAQLDLRSVVHVYWRFDPWLVVKLCIVGGDVGEGCW